MTIRTSHFRWVIVGLLFLISVVNYIDRASISYAIQSIAHEFHLSESNTGFILGAFGIGYALTTVLGGMAADHYGAKRTLTLSIFLWSVATLLTGLASGFMMVFISRILLGVAEGPSFPSVSRTISDWLPEHERARALSFALISVPLSLAISGPIASQLVLLFTWRGAYFILTLLALIWIPIWWMLFDDRPSQSRYINPIELNLIQQKSSIQSGVQEDKSLWKVLFFNRTLLANNWAFFVYGFYLFFFMTWLPTYLSTKFHLNLTQVGIYSMLPWLFAGGMMWAVGFISDAIFKKTKNLRLSRTYPIFFSQLLSSACVIPVIFLTDLNTVMFFLSLAIGFSMSTGACFYAVNVDLAKERAGTALGMMNTFFALSGFLAPSITGLIVSLTLDYNAVFYLLTGLSFSSAMLVFFLHNSRPMTHKSIVPLR